MNREYRLDDLIVQWVELRRQGQAPPPEELCRDCPHLLAGLKRCAAMVDAMGWLDAPVDAADPDMLSLPDLASITKADRFFDEPAMSKAALLQKPPREF